LFIHPTTTTRIPSTAHLRPTHQPQHSPLSLPETYRCDNMASRYQWAGLHAAGSMFRVAARQMEAPFRQGEPAGAQLPLKRLKYTFYVVKQQRKLHAVADHCLPSTVAPHPQSTNSGPCPCVCFAACRHLATHAHTVTMRRSALILLLVAGLAGEGGQGRTGGGGGGRGGGQHQIAPEPTAASRTRLPHERRSWSQHIPVLLSCW
jgi:hypothetical protein